MAGKYIWIILLLTLVCFADEIEVYQCPGFNPRTDITYDDGCCYLGWWANQGDCHVINGGGIINTSCSAPCDTSIPPSDIQGVCSCSDTYDGFKGSSCDRGRIWEAPAHSSFCIGFKSMNERPIEIESSSDFDTLADYSIVTSQMEPCFECVDELNNGNLDICVRVDTKDARAFYFAYAYEENDKTKIRLYATRATTCVSGYGLTSPDCSGWSRFDLSICSDYECTGRCCDSWCLKGKKILENEGYVIGEMDITNQIDDDCDCSIDWEDANKVDLTSQPSFGYPYGGLERTKDYASLSCSYPAYKYLTYSNGGYYSSMPDSFSVKRCEEDSDCSNGEKCVFPEDYPASMQQSITFPDGSCTIVNLGGVQIADCGTFKHGICLKIANDCDNLCKALFGDQSKGFQTEDTCKSDSEAKWRESKCVGISATTVSSSGYCWCINPPGDQTSVKVHAEVFGIYGGNNVYFPKISEGSPCDGPEECTGESLCTYSLGIQLEIDKPLLIPEDSPLRVDCYNYLYCGVEMYGPLCWMEKPCWFLMDPSECKSLRPEFYKVFCDGPWNSWLSSCIEKGEVHWDSLNRTWVCIPTGTATCSDLAKPTNNDINSDGLNESDECLIFHWSDEDCMKIMHSFFAKCKDGSFTSGEVEWYFPRLEYGGTSYIGGNLYCSCGVNHDYTGANCYANPSDDYPSASGGKTPLCAAELFGFDWPEGPKCSSSQSHGSGSGGGGGTGGGGEGGGGGGGNTQPEICNDGEDNDGDGLTDCEDTADCCSDPYCECDPNCYDPPSTGISPNCPTSVEFNQSITVTIPVSATGGTLSDLTCTSTQGTASASGDSCVVEIDNPCPGPVTVTVDGTVEDSCGYTHDASGSCTFNVQALEPKVNITQITSSPNCGDTVELRLECYDKYGTITPTRADYPTNVSWNLKGFYDYGTCASGANPCTAYVKTSTLSPTKTITASCSVDDYGESRSCPDGYWIPDEGSSSYTITCSGAQCITDVALTPVQFPACGQNVDFKIECLRNYGGGVWGIADVNSISATGFDTTTCGSGTNPCYGTKRLTGTHQFDITCDYTDTNCPTTSKTFNITCSNIIEDKLVITDFVCENISCIKKYAINRMYACGGYVYPVLSSVSCPSINQSMNTLNCHVTVLNNFGSDKTVSLTLEVNGLKNTTTVTATPCLSTHKLSIPVNAPIKKIISGGVSLSYNGNLYYYVSIISSRENTTITTRPLKTALPEYPSPIILLIPLIIIIYTLVRQE